MKTMRFLNYQKDSNKFEIKQGEIPQLSENEVLLKVLGTCVNRVDILEKRGLYKPVQNNDILGIELVGYEVDPVTLKSKKEKPEIVGSIVRRGAYAEYAKVQKSHLIDYDFKTSNFLKLGVENLKPQFVLEYAGISEAFITAYQLLAMYGNLNEDSVVYIPAGAGGVGTAAIQLCKQLFKCQVIASCSSQNKADFCKELGADKTIVYKDRNDEELRDIILDMTADKGVNCILDCIGPSKAQFHGEIIAEDGKWVLYGLLGGKELKKCDNILEVILMKSHFKLRRQDL